MNSGPGMRIEDVKVVDRHRRDLDDLDSLMASIQAVGLLQPIVVTKDGRLVAGERRLAACRRIGWESIPITVAENLTDAAALLHAERDENTCRKAMLPSEMASLGAAIAAIETDRARDRMADGGRAAAPGRPVERSGFQTGPFSEQHGEVRQVVGEALGMSARTYSDLSFVHKTATDPHLGDEEHELGRAALEQMDQTGSIQPVAKRLRSKLRAKREAQETRDAAMADPEPVTVPEDDPGSPDWIPPRGDSSPKAATRRRELIREMADRGYSSAQIGERISMLDGTVRRIAREHEIPIPADVAMGRSARRTIDSNRIIRETVSALEAQEMSLGLVNYDDLDRAEIQNWTASLSESIRVLNRLNKRLKEMVQ